MSAVDLSAVGNVVDPDYRHVTKTVTPAPPLTLPDAYLKWYLLHRPDQVVDPAVADEARALVADEVAADRLPISGDLGFVIHHLSGERVHLLLVFTWRDNNEMWETTYVKDDGPFRPLPQTSHRGVICVWEFGPVAHEHHAWTRYLRSDRTTAAKRAYAESLYSGPI
ncbi:hypothetical protein [Virgisporangium aurantiacum]|uniref:Uncharacterized protein n=1 Tax=Virgisporangium aurantiacum TaxID=175570 RepID=A0A8J4E2T3_9ACTN|nr:hypothetical protein [Virgisporangium aurantiacum]GIJ59218.1 hypothetical protein Vau01_067340 [Virgisporangium aurantiacum]